MASRRSLSRSTALLKSSSGWYWHRIMSRVVKHGTSFVTHLCSGFSRKCNACDAICHHFNKNWQESVPVTRISNIQNSKKEQKTTRDGVPSPTCAVRFVKMSSEPSDHHDIPNGENHEANCIVTTLCKACDIQNQSNVQLACVKT